MENANKFYNLDRVSQKQKRYAEKILLNETSKTPFTNLLEVGCGDGHLIKKLTKKFPEKKLTGLDYSPDMINKSKKNNIKIINANITKYKEKQNNEDKYDCIISNYVFTELNKKSLFSAFSNIKNILKKNGRFLFTITDPRTREDQKEFDGYKLDFLGKNYKYNKEDLLFKVLLWNNKRYIDVGIRDFHNPISIYTKLLSKAGFKDIKLTNIRRKKDPENFAILFQTTK